MNYRRMFFAVIVFSASLSVCAEDAERTSFGKWRLSVGGGFNGAVRSSVGMRNLPAPSGYVVPAGSATWAEAKNSAENYEFGDDGYICPDKDDNGFSTENWKLSADRYSHQPGDPNPEEAYFDLRNAYQEVVRSELSSGSRGNSDDPNPFGLSVEVSRELWVHDEAFENRWGVDFVAGLSYYFQRNVYRGYGTTMRADTVHEGEFQTIVKDPDAMYDYIEEPSLYPVDGMYGNGNEVPDYNSPALKWENVSTPVDLGGMRTVSSTRSFNANGDYRELEMLFMFRPWYEITDWWRVFGELGVGVSWGNFESEINGSGFSFSEDFDQWDCYGVAGLGTMFRYGMFDLSVDVFGRFLRDDLDVDGKYLNGSIRRSDWGFRVMVGVEF